MPDPNQGRLHAVFAKGLDAKKLRSGLVIGAPVTKLILRKRQLRHFSNLVVHH